MAQLIQPLAVSGSRKSDGTVNASGKVFLYRPGTTTAALGYQDEDLSQVHTTSGGGIVLDAAGKASIWLSGPVDVIIQDSSGTTVSTFLGFNWTRAEQVEVENDGYTGALEDASGAVTQALGGKTDLDTILTSFHTSIGPNGQYLESAGATAVNVQDFLRDVWISVRQFGADPTGNADATAAIQQTIDRVKARGGGVVYFPPGTYKISSALSLSSANGVIFMGAGTGVGSNPVSRISNTSTTGNVFTISACSPIAFSGLSITHTTTSSGSAISLTGCSGVTIDHCQSVNHRFGVDFVGACNTTLLSNVVISTDGNAASRAVRYNLTGLTATRHRILAGEIGASTGSAVEYNGTVSGALILGARFSGGSASGVLFNAALTGTRFAVRDCHGIDTLTTPFDLSGLATDPVFRQSGNEVDGYVVTQASGGGGGSNHTPTRSKGSEVHVRLTSGGAAVCTINAATPTPTTGMRDTRLTLRLTAAAGGNITWTFPAVYVLVGGGTTITGTDGNTDVVEFQWDVQTSEWRECFRSATTT